MCAHAHVKRGVFYYDISPRRKLIGTGVGRHEELLVLTVAKEESKVEIAILSESGWCTILFLPVC